MNDIFIKPEFLLENKTAEKLFFDYARHLPIIDYHNHLMVEDIAGNVSYENITRLWLAGDHYKWRVMRANGINEHFITGTADDKEKFFAWAETVPYTIGNPLYHWAHMELKFPFGISHVLLNPVSAEEIWSAAKEKLNKEEFSARGLLKQFNVEYVGTTDDPTDDLKYHQHLKESLSDIKVIPSFRPDKAMMIEKSFDFKKWLDRLELSAGTTIKDFDSFIECIRLRHNYFHENGCRVSDHGLEKPYADKFSRNEIEKIFYKALVDEPLNSSEISKFKSAVLYELCVMNHEKSWVQQFHIGAQRNNNSRMFNILGPDSGYDSIGESDNAYSLAQMLNKLEENGVLTKTVLYNLNPKDNHVFAAMAGNFQDGSTPGKIQYGAAWWFLDNKSGIEHHLDTLGNQGLLSRFIGMLTDSRSFLSFSRHEYFRRILCNMLGTGMEKGIIPDDLSLIGGMVRNICYYNARQYFSALFN